MATVYYTRKQWREAYRGAVAGEQTAKEAQTANLYTLNIIKGTQEAIVKPQIGFVLADISSFDNLVAMNFINQGKVNAGAVSVSAVLVRKSLPDYMTFGRSIYAQKYEPILTPAGQSGSGMELVFNTSKFTQVDVDGILKRSESIEISGTLSYNEGFGHRVDSKFCFAYVDLITSRGFMNCDEMVVSYKGFLRKQERLSKQQQNNP